MTNPQDTAGSLLRAIDEARLDATRSLDSARRVKLGQFFTPPSVAAFMAGMFDSGKASVRILDPGAGTGSLSSALVHALCTTRKPPRTISLTAYEVDPTLVAYLGETLERCNALTAGFGVRFEYRIVGSDFLEVGAKARTLDGQARENARRWETEVWVADAPSHIIHFNGERFLGPYDE